MPSKSYKLIKDLEMKGNQAPSIPADMLNAIFNNQDDYEKNPRFPKIVPATDLDLDDFVQQKSEIEGVEFEYVDQKQIFCHCCNFGYNGKGFIGRAAIEIDEHHYIVWDFNECRQEE